MNQFLEDYDFFRQAGLSIDTIFQHYINDPLVNTVKALAESADMGPSLLGAILGAVIFNLLMTLLETIALAVATAEVGGEGGALGIMEGGGRFARLARIIQATPRYQRAARLFIQNSKLLSKFDEWRKLLKLAGPAQWASKRYEQLRAWLDGLRSKLPGQKHKRAFKQRQRLGDESTSPWLQDPRPWVREHLESFRDGATFLVTESAYHRFIEGKETIGGTRGGVFALRWADADRILHEANGDIALVKQKLGIPEQYWHEPLWRVDIMNPLLHQARIPSGIEAGANDLFRWGGYTSGGQREIVLGPVPSDDFVARPTNVHPK